MFKKLFVLVNDDFLNDRCLILIFTRNLSVSDISVKFLFFLLNMKNKVVFIFFKDYLLANLR